MVLVSCSLEAKTTGKKRKGSEEWSSHTDKVNKASKTVAAKGGRPKQVAIV